MKTPTKPKVQRQSPAKSIAKEITQGMRELEAWMRSGEPAKERFTVHTVVLPDAPGEYDAATVQATRHRLGASQAVFARIVGVSLGLVRCWEQGQTAPSLIARRLLDEINQNPQRWRAMLHRPEKGASNRKALR